jgi:hypothetical protein
VKKFVVSFISVLLLTLSFISVLPVSADDSDSVFTDHIFSNLEDSYPHSSYSYMVVSYKSNSFSFYQCFVVSRSLKFFYNSSDRTVSTDGTFIDSFVHRFKEYSCNREVRYGNIVYADIKDFNIIYSDLPVYEGDVPIYTDTNAPFKSPVNAQFDFKSDIEFFCCLNDNATSLPVDNRVWIEVYDTLVAVETLVYKPYKYVYTKTITSSSPDVPNKHEQVIGDYLLANSVGPHYSISVDTLLHAGCKTDYYYTARAFVYNGSKPFEIANLTFKISSEGISTVDPTLKDPDNPDDPIMKTWNNDNRTYNYYNVNTGAEVDKDKLVYKFDSSVDPSVNGSGQDISDFDFNSDFSTDLTQGAGLVRTLFDKIIQSAGLSGFMITVLSVAVVGWFIFGSRR